MGLKDKLEAAGYDTSGLDEQALTKKLSDAGYDTSSLGGQPQASPATPPAQTPMNIAKDQLAKPVLQQLGELNDAAKGFGKSAEQTIAEGLAKDGTNPVIAALAGRAFNTLMNLPRAVTEGTASVAGPDAVVDTAIESAPAAVRALIPGQKAAVGKAIGEVDKAAGIKQVVPTVSNMAKRLDLPARERGFADIVNSVKGTLDSGEKMSPQDLSDFRDLVKQKFGDGTIVKGTRLDALASDANAKAGRLLNELVKGRSKLATDYATMAQVHNGLKLLAKAGAGAAGLGTAGVILRKLAQGM